jgi:hypothetical protein
MARHGSARPRHLRDVTNAPSAGGEAGGQAKPPTLALLSPAAAPGARPGSRALLSPAARVFSPAAAHAHGGTLLSPPVVPPLALAGASAGGAGGAGVPVTPRGAQQGQGQGQQGGPHAAVVRQVQAARMARLAAPKAR